MAFRILTDSCCDLGSQWTQKLDLTVVPLTLQFRGKISDDKNDDSLGLLYQGLRHGETAKTAAVNPARWSAAMEPILQAGADVLVLAFSSGLSATCQSAVMAAQELKAAYPQRKILVVDSLCASMGQGLLVFLACQKRDEGFSLEETAQWVEETKLHICHWFTVDDLQYLKRGGRISPATALMGTMLQIKPVLHLDSQGHLVSRRKARGRKAALNALAEKLRELGSGYDNRMVFLSHGDCLEDALYLEGILKKQYGVTEVVTGWVGSVIGSHSGPGTVALFFMGSER